MGEAGLLRSGSASRRHSLYSSIPGERVEKNILDLSRVGKGGSALPLPDMTLSPSVCWPDVCWERYCISPRPSPMALRLHPTRGHDS